MSSPRTRPDLMTLLRLFYDAPQRLGEFVEVHAGDMPAEYRTLLAHQEHMTVTVEDFHHSLVDVRVLETKIDDSHYARKILLARQSDGKVVQFGIVRLDFAYVSPDVRRSIESQKIPLGRVLIQHNVMREIQLAKLWRITPGGDLQNYFGISPKTTTFGRTALINCNGQPAVELLEIVAPVETKSTEPPA